MKYQLQLSDLELGILQVLLEEEAVERSGDWVDAEGYPVTEEFFQNLQEKLNTARGN